MSQFEYNDLSKFFVSVGIFLIGLTFLLPWLFFRENFDLLIKQSDLETYTATAQQIIRERQNITSYFPIGVLIVVTCSFAFGIALSVIGIAGWIRLERSNKKMEELRIENQELQNRKLTQEIDNFNEPQTTKVSDFKKIVDSDSKTLTMTEIPETKALPVPINYTWILNHWGSDVAFIEDGKMIFKGEKTRLETDGSHIDLKDILKVGKYYKVTCFEKALPDTTAQFQLWCHDNIGIDPHGSGNATPYATPSVEGEVCSVHFHAEFNTNIRIHLQYAPGKGQIEISEVKILELG